MNHRYLLAIESSCDETAAAVIREDGVVTASEVASQFELHEEFGGVVPEIASRAHVRRILPTIRRALERAEIRTDQLAGIAVTNEPGLVGSLLVGLTAAKTLAMSLDVPLIPVNHVEAHLYACSLDDDGGPSEGADSLYPAVGFVVSGGHTNLYDCRSATDFRLIAGTTDDAVGEAFDKAARILGLPYPGGPSIERAARDGDPKKYSLPRPMLHADTLNFSFSGLKTAVLYAARGVPGPGQLQETPPERVADLAASFQQAAIDVMTARCRKAARQTQYNRLLVGGGVAANGVFREQLAAMCRNEGIRLSIAPLRYCTDNAAMAGIAWELLRQNRTADLHCDVLPGLIRIPR